MFGTKDEVKQLNMFTARRASLLSKLRDKENITNITDEISDSYVDEFEELLNECRVCNLKVRELKRELAPKEYLKVNYDATYDRKENTGTALVVVKENKILSWFKNKINEYKFGYAVERTVKRDEFIEDNIQKQIEDFTVYLNVIKTNGIKAVFTKYMDEENEDSSNAFSKLKQFNNSRLNEIK